jgi:hypothetical protein
MFHSCLVQQFTVLLQLKPVNVSFTITKKGNAQMSTTNATIETLGLRATSAKALVYIAIADGKVHNLTSVRKSVIKKSGISTQCYAVIHGLGRILAASKLGKRVMLDHEADTIQLVSAAKSKPVAKKAVKKATVNA